MEEHGSQSSVALTSGSWSPSRVPDANQAQPHLITEEPTPRSSKRLAPDDFTSDHERLLHPSHRENAELVAEHYNQRPEVGKLKRKDSPIIGLKNFNNWIKAVMIAKFARPPIEETNSKPPPFVSVSQRKQPKHLGRVLDVGCGKGGDLGKWAKANIALFVGVDIAGVSIEQARTRWRDQKRKQFQAEFFELDCYSHPLADVVPAPLLTAFDVVSMQFCMHYAFENEEKVRMMLKNATDHLRPGGVFIGTIPNAKYLLKRLKKLGDKEEELSFGNEVYQIRFESRHPPAKGAHPYGHKYNFYLKDAVDAPEYVVQWDPFVALAKDYGLELDYKKEFHDIYQSEQESPEFAAMLQTMNVVDSKGESFLDNDQWEAANIYIGFVFKKVAPTE
ncbi:guanine-N(7)-methyltransferase domain-containing protein [Cantharellus anzutake]|uniref:guanine-N(7)-methyltransferase domain-containing protein n=1 Tax=Cantharellus anzutake TaxID=1750568 RepID=UPI001907F58F|nr:guanine-N(7)-methyltransferase domain-containing protein [Cantharellus anzutake]KAF8344198.1 guanine-N(7)-methyltransferase domain-containing protein [Cantharellus anzutake]